MRKALYISPVILVAIIGVAYYSWLQNYKKNLDWATAYSDYLASGCKVCFEYFDSISPDEIPELEIKIEHASGIVQQVAQAHTFYTDDTTSPKQRKKNERVEKLISLFLKKGADINYFRKNELGHGYTTLYATAQEGNPRLVKFLLENGADPTIKDTLPSKNFLPIDVAKEQLNKFNDNPKMQKALKEVIEILSHHNQEK